MVEIANGAGSGWVDYKWPNPQTNKIEDKSSYVEKMGDYFAGRRSLPAMTVSAGLSRRRTRETSAGVVRGPIRLGIFNNLSIQIKASMRGAAADLSAGFGNERLSDLDKDGRRAMVAVERSDTEAAGIFQRQRGCRCDTHENFPLRLLGQQWRQR